MSECSLASVSYFIAKKWAVPLIEEVAKTEKNGFSALHGRLKPISQKMLAKRLSQLEKDGVIKKTVTADEAAIRTSYKLTQKGLVYYDLLCVLKKWNEERCGRVGCQDRECLSCPLYLPFWEKRR